jgi:competence protein ComEA
LRKKQTLCSNININEIYNRKTGRNKMRGNLVLKVLLLTLMLCGGVANADSANEAVGVTSAEQVNINDADAETLHRVLTGVGKSKAQAIVAYREAHGKFYSAEELTAVRGIGASTVRKNESRIVVD